MPRSDKVDEGTSELISKSTEQSGKNEQARTGSRVPSMKVVPVWCRIETMTLRACAAARVYPRHPSAPFGCRRLVRLLLLALRH